jgi:hypothetical protein
MPKNLKGLVTVAAFMTLAGAGIANAQTSSSQQPSALQDPSTPSRETTISGELMRVNPDTKMFTVKNPTGEIQFKYSDQTVVTGAQKTVAGLATMNGEQVTVQYRVENGANIATKIEVKEKK